MKRIMILTAALAMAAVSSFAQVNIGAGYSAASMNPSEGDNLWNNGFNLSVGYNLPLGLGFGFNPSVEYSYLYRSADMPTEGDGAGSAALSNNFNEHYLNVPLLFDYGYEITSNARIFVFAGPTASFGLYADSVVKPENGDKATTALWGQDAGYRRWDVRIGGGIGLDICRHWRIQAGYDYGLLNRTKTDGMTLHYHNLQAGVTYLFK